MEVFRVRSRMAGVGFFAWACEVLLGQSFHCTITAVKSSCIQHVPTSPRFLHCTDQSDEDVPVSNLGLCFPAASPKEPVLMCRSNNYPKGFYCSWHLPSPTYIPNTFNITVM